MLDELIQRFFGAADAPSAKPRLELACITNTGLHREHNEDNVAFFGTVMPEEHQSLDGPLVATAHDDEPILVGVFDGMGGELLGEAASYAAAVALGGLDPAAALDEQDMARAFRVMQDAVASMRANRRVSSTGSTAVVLAAHGDTATLGNLGDSPAFLLRDGSLTRLSVEHTDEQLLRSLGLERKPALTQYLGVDEADAPIEPHIVRFGLRAGDVILLASDGLTDMVGERDIAGEMGQATDMAALVAHLCDLALANGGVDNVTILACRVAGA